jgi:1-acyl-sn-glycerol-3-phosphate acyltransferase
MYNSKYDDIRPYYNHEVNEKIQILLADPVFDRVLMHVYEKPEKIQQVKKFLSTFHTIEELQHKYLYELIEMVVETTTTGLTYDGIDYLEKDKPYLFISNHRDIILDSALLNYLIFKNGMNTTQIAIGSNLLILDWIVHAVKLNRSFIINREATARELLAASQKVSEYIRDSITKQHMSVWIAQREGRTKDGADLTQISLLKMLNMSNSKSFAEGFSELNVVPVSISYEIEPCGIGKVRELLKKNGTNGYVKTSKDDLKSMAKGMFGQKGGIHFAFGEPLNAELENFDTEGKPNGLCQQLAGCIDNHIHKQFKLWPNNYVAHDVLTGKKTYAGCYNGDDKKTFMKMVKEAQTSLNENPDDIRTSFLNLYANPVINANN